MKVLNAYACLGGNRLKWDQVADIEVTAVELDEELAKLAALPALNEKSMQSIKGIGTRKIEKYGQRILNEQNETSKPTSGAS